MAETDEAAILTRSTMEFFGLKLKPMEMSTNTSCSARPASKIGGERTELT